MDICMHKDIIIQVQDIHLNDSFVFLPLDLPFLANFCGRGIFKRPKLYGLENFEYLAFSITTLKKNNFFATPPALRLPKPNSG